MNVNRFALILVAGLALPLTGAQAADIDSGEGSYKDAPVEMWTWQGFYFGGNAGYASAGDGDETDLFRNPNGILGPLDIGGIGELQAEGGFLGLQGGYNWQRGRFVFGIEGDIQAGDVNDGIGTSNFEFPPATATTGFFGTAETDMNYFGTIRGRIGLAQDNWLLYVTGGYAFADVDYSLIATNRGGTPVGNTVTFDESEVRGGYVIGAGAEWAIRNNLTLKIEYQYLDFDDETYTAQSFQTSGAPSGVFYDSRSELDLHTIKVGVNYKLNQ